MSRDALGQVKHRIVAVITVTYLWSFTPQIAFCVLNCRFFLPLLGLLYCRIDAVYHHCTRKEGSAITG